MNYTKGEWKVGEYYLGAKRVYSSNGDLIATLTSDMPEFIANANLIASAPELYEACKFIDYMWRNKISIYKAERDKARELLNQALAKSEGAVNSRAKSPLASVSESLPGSAEKNKAGPSPAVNG